MEWHQTEKFSLIRLRNLLMEKRDDVFSEPLCRAEELVVWAWHASHSVLEEHGVKKWRRLNGTLSLGDIIEGDKFKDGAKVVA